MFNLIPGRSQLFFHREGLILERSAEIWYALLNLFSYFCLLPGDFVIFDRIHFCVAPFKIVLIYFSPSLRPQITRSTSWSSKINQNDRQVVVNDSITTHVLLFCYRLIITIYWMLYNFGWKVFSGIFKHLILNDRLYLSNTRSRIWLHQCFTQNMCLVCLSM